MIPGPSITARQPSLADVHSTVNTSHVSLWKRMFAFAGPAYLVSVGYMDPGNWATDLEGGARFGYRLLWVLVMSNAMAVLLQTLSARLGIVSERDLAQACRETYPRPVTYALWILCEIAIVACDLAEVLGAAIALNLLFKIPLLAGVIITAADTLLVLWLQRFGIRLVEAIVLSLIAMIAACFCIEIFLAHPNAGEVVKGLVPRLSSQTLYIVIGILGATVMPHNLYLHSALVQTRRIGSSPAERRTACHYNLIDSVIALNGAMLVNAAILVMAAAVFFKHSLVVTEIQQAHLLLAPLMGTTVAGVVFAIALLCSGQSSTLTGTLAGQIVMEGFLDVRLRPWLRRLITRGLAIVPAAATIYFAGDRSTYQLLLLSQVVLSMQLPFAVIPLIHFTSDRKRMGSFANKLWVVVLAWITAVWITLQPLFARWGLRFRRAPVTLAEPEGAAADVMEPAPVYRRILVPLDHTRLDRTAIAHAAAMARTHHAKLFLFHVEEGVTSQVYGELSSTAEVKAGQKYLNDIVASLRADSIEVETEVCHSLNPNREIVRYAQRIQPDLLIMGAHGHGRLGDLIFGDTINPVRHQLNVPILVVRDPRK